MLGDTIAAIATPIGVASIGVIRIGGDEALSVLRALFSKGGQMVPRMMTYGDICDPDTGDVVDQVCAVFFKGPASFTGEDVVEIHSHGSPYLVKRILALVLAQGARLAEPGEFSRRAVGNGKMRLAEAEAMIDLIHSRNRIGSQVALTHLKGALSRFICDIRSHLMPILEQVEGSIDFPEEVDRVDRTRFIDVVCQVESRVAELLNTQDFGRAIMSGIKCVIVGQPNVGKSSFLNAVLGENRAIVTSVPGTTRDFIEGSIDLGGLTFDFIDTAGVRESESVVELLGIKKVRGLIRSADLIVWVLDAGRKYGPENDAVYRKISCKKTGVVVINKSDLRRPRLDVDHIPNRQKWPVQSLSAKTGNGIDAFKSLLVSVFQDQLDYQPSDILCNARQIGVLQKIRRDLRELLAHLKDGYEDDVVAIDLKSVIFLLGELSGDEITEEVLDGVFSRFCVGK